MKDKDKKSITTPGEKFKITLRRLLLSKQVYLHGLEHSTKQGAVNRILAITNFHNAIEVTLRAIILRYEIRTEKRLNITFEAMLNEIDKYFRSKPGRKPFPYRHELRDLNNRRNLALHEAVEPPTPTIEEWWVFTKRFLVLAFDEYFGVDFKNISMLDLVEDALLKKLLQLSYHRIQIKDYKSCIALAKLAYEYAAHCVPSTEYVPLVDSDLFAISRDYPKLKQLSKIVRRINNDISDIKRQIALLTTGTNFADYKRFEEITPIIQFMAAGNPSCSYKATTYSQSDAQWVYNFALDTIVTWQSLGLSPVVPEWSTNYCKVFLKKNENSDKKEIVFSVPKLYANNGD